MREKWYPLKFEPILVEKVWGGQKLKTILNKEGNGNLIGESWEVSDVEGASSIVAQGPFKGKSLKELLRLYKQELVGEHNYREFGDTFPLLTKFIDAKQDLSIQLHPDDDLALQRHNSYGKTEMWYVMQADEEANLIVGFNQGLDKQEYLQHLKAKNLPSILNFDIVQEGDTYFIETGLVHAIGAGVLLAEIQQTSDITYRIYDWDRLDINGQPRELHTDLALEAIDFENDGSHKIDYTREPNRVNTMVNCPYFTTNFLPVNLVLEKENTLDSFIIYMCVKGNVEIKANGFITSLSYGETVLIPAAIKNYTIIPHKDSELLEVYIK
ncbi:type I phosphomannose isomerase catalytic subunit [Mangrovimonas aestuarii]|uniref:type I phosphomannose isomerase catalytic subunit n=1 Tax=Mangrovimonas aestuarii TaxID=3018443 RepID=UPI002379FFEA|nr:type I phosphomannose isomerase catalytic subunit [Mangrovimonas aestuarii]